MINPIDSELCPVVTGVHYERLAGDVGWQAAEVIRCGEEPWYWLVNYAWTVQKDENVEGSAVNRFPPDDYLRYCFGLMFSESFLVVDKSRQMRMTWLLMAYALWRAQFGNREEIVCQTKQQDIADTELVKRAFFMASNEPFWMRPNFGKNDSSFCKLVFPGSKSLIRGIPSGGDKIRAYNPTRFILDEAGFLEGEFDECRTAALACCKDVKLVSTANGGQWGDFVNAIH